MENQSKFVLISTEFGYDMFWADNTKSSVMYLTDVIDEALVFESMPEITAKSVNRQSGYNFTPKFVKK